MEGISSKVRINVMWRQYDWEIIMTVNDFDTMRRSLSDFVKAMRCMETSHRCGLTSSGLGD